MQDLITDRVSVPVKGVGNPDTPAAPTMSSREIAELTGKEHKNVLADVRNMLDQLGMHSAEFSANLPDAYGRPQVVFNLPKDLTITLVSGYSIAMRHRIVTRWMELEAAQAPAPAKGVQIAHTPGEPCDLSTSVRKSRTPATGLPLFHGRNCLNKELVYAYAMWVSPAFHLKVIRVVTLDGAPWFVAKDACELLGLKPRGTNYSHHTGKLDSSERRSLEKREACSTWPSLFSATSARIGLVSESGLYVLGEEKVATGEPLQESH